MKLKLSGQHLGKGSPTKDLLKPLCDFRRVFLN